MAKLLITQTSPYMALGLINIMEKPENNISLKVTLPLNTAPNLFPKLSFPHVSGKWRGETLGTRLTLPLGALPYLALKCTGLGCRQGMSFKIFVLEQAGVNVTPLLHFGTRWRFVRKLFKNIDTFPWPWEGCPPTKVLKCSHHFGASLGWDLVGKNIEIQFYDQHQASCSS